MWIELLYLHLNVDFVGYSNTHDTTHHTVARIDLDEPLVYPHLVLVPRLAAVAAGCPPSGDHELLRRQWYGSYKFDAYLLGDVPDLVADTFELLGVGACEFNTCAPRHTCSPSCQITENLNVSKKGSGNLLGLERF